MDHRRDRQTHDEIRARRLVLVDGEDLPRVVLEVVAIGDPRNGGVKATPRISLLTEKGRAVLVLEIDAHGAARVQVGDPDRGPLAEVEPGVMLLGWGGNTRVVAVAREDGGVLDLCDQEGAPVLRLPENGR
jgi:hypothetical protein